ncbi:MAG: efflux RND transporter periplasmic adaptor subunit [Chitinophagales bacterium]|jgi:HlyD family secretion protein|nr:efflux RND transporter periplasmic adaptor subunit [Bacteroidota bacterium]MBP8250048.1 efflux RND transporter periplasmic adaptor subunit [Chitinophagales bacterium]MBK9504893.1 efflux RND transporter periplasmic adaptor subunit [Bacteroidota bacterium]MBK9555901.1 efflux RND transporter periplasmic adaptor subunit [Bacteroidota bacterium]MBL0279328.1 efflux RND transporter periplasmic adaptor subunit [Bacteroidota bacterium]
MRSLKILGIIIAVLIVVLVIGSNKGWFNGGAKITVNAEAVEKRTIVETVTASGKIYPVTQVSISAEISGEIVDLPVKEGDKVKEGDLLMRINPDLYESQVEQAQAGLDNTKAQLATARARVLQSKLQFDNAKIAFDRSAQLLKDKVIAQMDYEQSQLAYETSKAEYEIAQESVTAMEFTVKSSEAMLREMRNNYKRTSIYAPAAGTVVGLNKKKGEKVLGTIQMTGDQLMSIADLTQMEIQVDVSENDVLRIDVGDTANIEVDAYLNRKFKGVVFQIANSAGSGSVLSAVSDQATNFKVKIYLLPESYADLMKESNGKYPFYPGMSATVEIKTDVQRNILSIPIQAITTREDTTDTNKDKKINEIVYVLDGEKAKEVIVTSGLQDDNFIQIKTGLTEGEKVISGPYNTITNVLKDGDMVKVEEEKDEKEDKK